MKRLVTVLASSALLWSGALFGAQAHSAPTGDPCLVENESGGYEYICTEGEEGNPGAPGDGDDGGVSAEPACEFEGQWDEFCRGTAPCYMFDPAHLQSEEHVRDEIGQDLPDRPEDADHLVFISCKPPGGEAEGLYLWNTELEETVSTEDRMIAARGALRLPTITPVFNPPRRTLVNLPTWWWAEGGTLTEIAGTPALSMIAYATPQSMTVRTAGQTVTCPIVVERSDACQTTYRRAGEHEAELTIGYAIRFEMGGEVIPTTSTELGFMATSETVEVPVREVQSRVTGLG